MSLRLIFMGTPDFAVPTLLELVAHGHEVVAVYTRAPKPAGRGMKLQPTSVEQEARRLGIPVLTPTTLKTPEALAEFRAHNADAAVVVAYGMILPQAILDAPADLLDEHLTIACSEGAIRILELQRAGKVPMKAADFLRGTALQPPMRLS